jgi:phospholipase/carboxylesterase
MRGMNAPDPSTQAGDLLHDAAYALAFRMLEPRPDPPEALLVLLHGVGGDEHQLEPIGARAPAGTLVVLPRGQRSISGGMIGWYRVGLSDDGLQVVEDEEIEARDRLVEFVAQLQSRHDVPPERTVVAGFSQGGMLAASLALVAPDRLAAFAMLCGTAPPEIDAAADRGALSHLRALVVHGREDPTLPAADAEAAAARFEALGIHCELRLHPGGHELTPTIEADMAGWLEGVLATP